MAEIRSPNSRRVVVATRLHDDEADRLAALAESRGVTRSSLIADALAPLLADLDDDQGDDGQARGRDEAA